MKSVSLLNAAIVACSCIFLMPANAQTSVAEQQDARVIELLRQAGADLTRVHDIDFVLIFNRGADAAAAAAEVQALGYDIAELSKSSGGKKYEVRLKRKMTPALSEMQAATRTLEALAASHNGYYDGWGTVAVK